jgi:hypothetical protein
VSQDQLSINNDHLSNINKNESQTTEKKKTTFSAEIEMPIEDGFPKMGAEYLLKSQQRALPCYKGSSDPPLAFSFQNNNLIDRLADR